MSIVVGIDPSLTSAGIAILQDGNPVLLTSLGHAGHDADTWLIRSRRIVSQSRAIVAALPTQIDIALIEGPSYGSKFGDPWDRAALWHGLYAALSAKRVPVAVVAPKTRAKWATGKGNANKAQVLEAVRDDWADWRSRIRNHDISDALVMAAMGACHLGDPLPIRVPEWRVKGLEAVAWPEGIRNARV
jgi:Holliday junction resolvasome RuvABC endonuclease subunit